MKNQSVKSALILDDGSYFFGTTLGADISHCAGEICFNTAMTGYQESLTDPSYQGQIITFTFPHIGNTGWNMEDVESINKNVATGAIFREMPSNPSNHRSIGHIDSFLKSKNILAICNIDTRLITQKIRKKQISNAVILKDASNLQKGFDIVKSMPNMDGMELSSIASCTESYQYCEGKNGTIAVIDYGCKENILRILKSKGTQVIVFPYNVQYEEIAKIKPCGVLLSNGPGDPRKTLKYTESTIKNIIKNGIPLFGICLGHQLLGLTLGCTVGKLPQGHRGANHPVIDLDTSRVEITAQNHGFACINVPSHVKITHKSLFDGVIEGIILSESSITIDGKTFVPNFTAAVQYHPESSAGPHDSQYLFDRFINAAFGR